MTFTATVAGSAPSIPDGTVTFKDGTTAMGPPVSLNSSSQASFTSSTLAAGPHTIRAEYNGNFFYADSSGTVSQVVFPPLDMTSPSVTINQAGGQADPTTASPIHFTVVFDEPVADFGNSAGDVSLSGSAGATTAVVTEIGPLDGTTYDIAVSGMTGSGTVTAGVPAAAATDASGNPNVASTSLDNTVTYAAPTPPPPDAAPTVGNVNTILREGGHVGSVSVTVSWSASDDVTPTDSLVFQLQRRRFRMLGPTAWQDVATVTGLTSLYQVPLWHRYQYRVRAMDQAGHWSDYAEAYPVTFTRRDERSFTRDASWTITLVAGSMRGNVARSSTPGGTASLTFTGNGVALVATTGPGQGTLQACIDPGTASQSCRMIDLSSMPAGLKQLSVVFTLPWATHTLRVTVVAGNVDLDGAIFSR